MTLLLASWCAVLILTFLSTAILSALQAITSTEISGFKEFHPKVASVLNRFKDNMARVTITLFMVMIPSIIFSMYRMCITLQHFPLRYSLAGVIIYSYFFIFIAVIVPQSLGKRFRETIAFLCAFPLHILTYLMLPATGILFAVEKFLFRYGVRADKKISEEILSLVSTARKRNVLSREQAHLISRSIEFSHHTAEDIMVPVKDIHLISDTVSLNEALIEAHLHHHTRFPLTHDNNVNRIIGYVNFKDIVGALRVNPANPTLLGIKRPIESVQATTPLPQLLHLLTRGYRHIVIVKDENDHTLGMVTLEDVTETLLGSIEDEYDTPPAFIIQIAEDRYCAGGGTRFNELREKISDAIPDWDVTIDEWISGQVKGKLPEQFTTTYQNLSIRVRKIARGKVFDTIIRKLPDHPPAD